jgi:hypothetical protein
VKKITLKELPGDANTETMKYSVVLREVIRRPLNPQAGMGIDEMRQSIRVMDALDSADGTLELEDSDYQHLRSKVDAMQWLLVDRRIIQLVDDVRNAGA